MRTCACCVISCSDYFFTQVSDEEMDAIFGKWGSAKSGKVTLADGAKHFP
jgi:hypothetical protein